MLNSTADMAHTQVDETGMVHYTLRQGRRAALDVRSQDVPFILEYGQIIQRPISEPLQDTSEPTFAQGVGWRDQRQQLTLSKHFKLFNPETVLMRRLKVRKSMKRTLRMSSLMAATLFAIAPAAQSADCVAALEIVFDHEGGYQNSREDAGNWSSKKVGVGKMCGGTKFGIACGHNPGVDIKSLTREQAGEIYRNRECRNIRMDELQDQSIATLLLDLAVNMGSDMAVKLMGTTINLVNAPEEQITFDETMTDEMVTWLNDNTKTREQVVLFYAVLTLAAIDRYAYIVESNPKQAVWLLGWIRRLIPKEIEAIRPNRTLKPEMP